jgi:crotonobetainyl-CoA:carnitine CoA-transferase CaiB-like acyl-CoA transferase
MLMADQGAEVIKIDPPGSTEVRTVFRSVLDRGKYRLPLDLKSVIDIEKARTLIKSADVIIENFRPGVMERLGIGAKAVSELNSRLVHLSLPGFSSTDTEKANLRAFEGILSAATGVFTDVSRRNTEPPIYTPIPMASVYGAVQGVIAATIALYAREETGIGARIEVPLAGAAMSAMGILLFDIVNAPARYLWSEPGPLFASYQGSDGKWLFWLAAGHSRNTRNLLKALDIYETLLQEGMIDVSVYDNLSRDDNIPDSGHWSSKWTARVRSLIELKIREKTAAEWVELLRVAGVPCALHRTTQEWLHAHQTDDSGLTVMMEDPFHGPVRQFGIQATLSGSPDFHPKPPQDFSSHSKDMIGKKLQPVPKKDKQQGNLLEGLRVLDLSNVLAGPCSTRILAEYGADVIKIDTPDPLFGPRVYIHHATETGMGKRSMLLNLKSARGLAVLHRLVERADVIVHNFRPGVAERLGIGFDELNAVNPDLVYLHLSALDGPRVGPWHDLPGFDPMIQAMTGIQFRYGGIGKPPMLHAWGSCVDYITGYCGTYGLALALLKRKRGRARGLLVRTSLAQGAQLVQAPFMISSGSVAAGLEQHGQQSRGEHSLYHLYQAKDGWIFLAGRQEDLRRLQAVEILKGIPEGPEDELARTAFIEQRIREREVSFWVVAFNEAGCGCHPVRNIEDVRSEYLHEVSANLQGTWDDGRSISVIRTPDHPSGCAVDLCAPTYARINGNPLKLGKPAPQIGIQTREILLEAGYANEDVDELVSANVIKEQFARDYLPH